MCRSACGFGCECFGCYWKTHLSCNSIQIVNNRFSIHLDDPIFLLLCYSKCCGYPGNLQSYPIFLYGMTTVMYLQLVYIPGFQFNFVPNYIQLCDWVSGEIYDEMENIPSGWCCWCNHWPISEGNCPLTRYMYFNIIHKQCGCTWINSIIYRNNFTINDNVPLILVVHKVMPREVIFRITHIIS